MSRTSERERTRSVGMDVVTILMSAVFALVLAALWFSVAQSLTSAGFVGRDQEQPWDASASVQQVLSGLPGIGQRG